MGRERERGEGKEEGDEHKRSVWKTNGRVEQFNFEADAHTQSPPKQLARHLHRPTATTLIEVTTAEFPLSLKKTRNHSSIGG